MKESPKQVRDFIRFSKEEEIHEFFMNQIDGLLLNYEPGEPKMKPDVLKQIEEITKERAKLEAQARAQHYQQMMQQQQMQQNGGLPPIPGQEQMGLPQIAVNEPGKPPRVLSAEEIVQLIQGQQQHIQHLQQQLQQPKINQSPSEILMQLPKQPPRMFQIQEIAQIVEMQHKHIEGLMAQINTLETKVQSLTLEKVASELSFSKNITVDFAESDEPSTIQIV
jgi:hypothetical protein